MQGSPSGTVVAKTVVNPTVHAEGVVASVGKEIALADGATFALQIARDVPAVAVEDQGEEAHDELQQNFVQWRKAIKALELRFCRGL